MFERKWHRYDITGRSAWFILFRLFALSTIASWPTPASFVAFTSDERFYIMFSIELSRNWGAQAIGLRA
jgi:hypothetical protein